jgi:hypothetical protein
LEIFESGADDYTPSFLQTIDHKCYLYRGLCRNSVSKRKTLALGFMCIIAATVASFYILLQQDSVEERTTAKIAAFNIQVFWRAKRQKEDVMAVLTKIVREFDIVCLHANIGKNNSQIQVKVSFEF